jgi:hypothetical protein
MALHVDGKSSRQEAITIILLKPRVHIWVDEICYVPAVGWVEIDLGAPKQVIETQQQ